MKMNYKCPICKSIKVKSISLEFTKGRHKIYNCCHCLKCDYKYTFVFYVLAYYNGHIVGKNAK